jgi:hypothetical protein
MVGSRGFEPRSARSERAASAVAPRAGTGPSGWTRTTTTRVKGPACCVDTTEGVERMAGFEPAPQGLEGPQAAVTPHSRWFGLSSHPGRTRTGIVHRSITTSVGCQRTRSCERVNSCRPHVTSRPIRRQNFPATWPALLSRAGGQNKKAFQGVALEGLDHDECRAFRALSPSWSYRASRR